MDFGEQHLSVNAEISKMKVERWLEWSEVWYYIRNFCRKGFQSEDGNKTNLIQWTWQNYSDLQIPILDQIIGPVRVPTVPRPSPSHDRCQGPESL